MKKRLTLLALLSFCSSLVAETIDVEYSRFYSHLRKLDNEDTQALQFAFGFVHVNQSRLCNISQAKLVTDKKEIPVSISTEQRFTLPYEKALKLANAVVRIELDDPTNQCDMSVQLETKPDYLNVQLTNGDMRFLLQQYDAFFNEMGSFLSFMMPSVKGLTLHFEDDQLDRQLANAPAIINGILTLDKKWIEQGNSVTLPVKPIRITAQASRD